MLEIILVIALFSCIMHLIDKPYKKRIINANTLEEALVYRKIRHLQELRQKIVLIATIRVSVVIVMGKGIVLF